MLKYTLVPELIEEFSPEDPFFKILLAIPSECAVLCCGRDFSGINPRAVSLARERGVSVKIGSYEDINNKTIIPAGHGLKEEALKTVADLKGKGARFLFYCGRPDNISAIPGRGEYFFYDCETQLIGSILKGQFSLDERGVPEIGLTPSGGEAAVSGLLRNYDLAGFKTEDKKILQARLAAEHGVVFDQSRPLIVFTHSPKLDRSLVEKCLKGLSANHNLLITGCGDPEGLSDLADRLKDRNVFADFRQNGGSGGLARQAADVVMADMFSAEFILAAMLGLRTIPVYTSIMFDGGDSAGFSFVRELRQYKHIVSSLVLDILSPTLLDEPGPLAEKISDAAYWEKYDNLIKEIQFYAFGRHMFGDEALSRATDLVTRLIQYESLVTPEAGQKLVTAPVNRTLAIKMGL